jgi:hypothetical protein
VRIKIALAAVLILTAVAVCVVLLHSPMTVAATNGVQPAAVVGVVTEDGSACQPREELPAGSSAIRLDLDAVIGPRVNVEVLDGSRVITRGTQGTAWYGSAVTVAVRPLPHAFSHVRVCFKLSAVSGYLALRGIDSGPTGALTIGGRHLPGRIGIAYLRPTHESWWSRADTVIRHMSLGRATRGTWIALPIAALLAAAIAIASWVIVRELR